jgi:hypothetical protein
MGFSFVMDEALSNPDIGVSDWRIEKPTYVPLHILRVEIPKCTEACRSPLLKVCTSDAAYFLLHHLLSYYWIFFVIVDGLLTG